MQDAAGLMTGDANGYLVGQIFSDVFKVSPPMNGSPEQRKSYITLQGNILQIPFCSFVR